MKSLIKYLLYINYVCAWHSAAYFRGTIRLEMILVLQELTDLKADHGFWMLRFQGYYRH